jgi:hypothetical protein
MRFSEEIDLREGLVYDPAVKGFDSNFWKGDTANQTFDTVNNAIRIGDSALVGSMSSYSQYVYGDFEFKIQLDSLSPDSNDSEKFWGLRNLGDSDQRGAAYFSLAYDTVADTAVTRAFRAIVFDEAGVRRRLNITWDTTWNSAQVRYRILWERDGYKFLVNDTVYATIGPKSGDTWASASANLGHAIPQALRLSNRSSDDTSSVRLNLLSIRHARKII